MSKKLLALLLSAVMLFALLAACGTDTPESPTAATETSPTEAETPATVTEFEVPTEIAEEPADAPAQFRQAPMLDGRDLPPVNERLPINPLVVTPYDTIGTYGGTWNKSVILGNRIHALATIGMYEGRNWVVWNYDRTEIVPNLATSLEASPDGTTFTITLREGLRWSDGAPMTSSDVLFWFEAQESHPDINPGWATAAVKVERVEIVDEITFRLVYNVPAPLMAIQFAAWQWSTQFLPQHYMEQFHIDFSDNAEALASEAGFDSWVSHFADRADWQVNPDKPTMGPFILMTEGAAATALVYERNPFFFAVDTEGNQLPYIDSVVINIVESPDITLMRTAAGEIDMQVATLLEDFLNFPFLAENAAGGNYSVHTFEFAEAGVLDFHINSAHRDPYVRAVFGNPEFRKALSHALDRETIIATHLTVGPVSSTPRNYSPAPNSVFFDPAWSSAYTTFDLDRANQMLDEIGLDNRNSAGIRLLANGEPLSMIIDVPTFNDLWLDLALAVADYWREVGMIVSVNSLEPALWTQRREANDFDVSANTGDGFAVLSQSALNSYTGFLSAAWGNFYQQGFIIERIAQRTDGMEVPADIQRLWELGAAIVTEVNEARRLELLNEVFQIHKDNLFVVGIGTRLPGIYIVGNHFKNVPPLDGDWGFGATGHGRASQYFIQTN